MSYYFIRINNEILGVKAKEHGHVICLFASKTIMKEYLKYKKIPTYSIYEISDLESYLKMQTSKVILITRIIGKRVVYKLL